MKKLNALFEWRSHEFRTKMGAVVSQKFQTTYRLRTFEPSDKTHKLWFEISSELKHGIILSIENAAKNKIKDGKY